MSYLNSFCGGMCKFNAKFDADSLLYSLSQFECDGHTVHMFPQWCLLPLTSTVKWSLFTYVHSSPVPSAPRLHQCCANYSCYINNGLISSGYISFIYIYIHIYIYTHTHIYTFIYTRTYTHIISVLLCCNMYIHMYYIYVIYTKTYWNTVR